MSSLQGLNKASLRQIVRFLPPENAIRFSHASKATKALVENSFNLKEKAAIQRVDQRKKWEAHLKDILAHPRNENGVKLETTFGKTSVSMSKKNHVSYKEGSYLFFVKKGPKKKQLFMELRLVVQTIPTHYGDVKIDYYKIPGVPSRKFAFLVVKMLTELGWDPDVDPFYIDAHLNNRRRDSMRRHYYIDANVALKSGKRQANLLRGSSNFQRNASPPFVPKRVAQPPKRASSPPSNKFVAPFFAFTARPGDLRKAVAAAAASSPKKVASPPARVASPAKKVASPPKKVASPPKKGASPVAKMFNNYRVTMAACDRLAAQVKGLDYSKYKGLEVSIFDSNPLIIKPEVGGSGTYALYRTSLTWRLSWTSKRLGPSFSNVSPGNLAKAIYDALSLSKYFLQPAKLVGTTKMENNY